MAESDQQTAPPEGEATKRQQVPAMVGGVALAMPGAPRSAGTYATYRRMRSNPTVALARIAATAPIRAATWSVQKADEATDEQLEFIRGQITWLWSRMIKDMLYSLDYGWAAFEKVYDLVTVNGRLLYRLRKLKPLLVDSTKILVSEETGAFVGLSNQGTTLPDNKALVVTYDGEAGNLHGRSRHENIRKVWDAWDHVLKKEAQYVTKAAGVIPMIEYPEGMSQDATGAEVSNFDMSKQILMKLGKGEGVCMPNTLSAFADDLIRQGVDISKLKAWIITFLEPKGAHGAEYVRMMRHHESLMMRGWLVPERTALEGTHGTLAEAEEHSSLSLAISELVFKEIVRHINWYIVDPLLMINYGADAAGTIWVEPEQLANADKAFFRDMISKILTAPANIDLFQSWLDVTALMDLADLPKASESLDVLAGAAERAERLKTQGLVASTLAHIAGSVGLALSGQSTGA